VSPGTSHRLRSSYVVFFVESSLDLRADSNLLAVFNDSHQGSNQLRL
jgi:hypothetical protein